MEFHYKKQSQFEPFPGAPSGSGQLPRSYHFLREFTLPPENTIVLCIVLLMILVLSFSFGVERGRKVSPFISSVPAQKISLQNQNNAIMPTSSKPAIAPMAVNKNMSSPVVPASVPVAPVAKPIENFNYTIQVASYKQASYAQKEADQLKTKGFEAFVLTKGSYSIVCVGKFMQTAQAKKMASRLKARYKNILVRSL